jgi:hypothetical protein
MYENFPDYPKIKLTAKKGNEKTIIGFRIGVINECSVLGFRFFHKV